MIGDPDISVGTDGTVASFFRFTRFFSKLRGQDLGAGQGDGLIA
jgi:hypothetical protein